MTNLFSKLYEDEKGASSVLIIFMMLVLVTLGAFAITSANVNYKFSQRAVEWNRKYYGLDAQGEEFLKEFDLCLAQAESSALEYVENNGFKALQYQDIPTEIQREIYNGFMDSGISSSYATEALNKIYFYYANRYLTQLSLTFPNAEVYTVEEGNIPESIITEIKLEDDRPDEELFGLSISVRAEPVSYTANEQNGSLLFKRANDNLRYKIEDWHEYQAPVNEDELPEAELWDGSF